MIETDMELAKALWQWTITGLCACMCVAAWMLAVAALAATLVGTVAIVRRVCKFFTTGNVKDFIGE